MLEWSRHPSFPASTVEQGKSYQVAHLKSQRDLDMPRQPIPLSPSMNRSLHVKDRLHKGWRFKPE